MTTPPLYDPCIVGDGIFLDSPGGLGTQCIRENAGGLSVSPRAAVVAWGSLVTATQPATSMCWRSTCRRRSIRRCRVALTCHGPTPRCEPVVFTYRIVDSCAAAGLTLKSSASPVRPNTTVRLTASVTGTPPPGLWITVITDVTSRRIVGECLNRITCTTDVRNGASTHTYCADVISLRLVDLLRIVRSSAPVTVIWRR